MPFQPVPLGTSSNLDIDDTSAGDGQGVSLVNFYLDRANAYRTIPPMVNYTDLGTGQAVWVYYSALHGITVFISAGRVWTQSSPGGAIAEVGTVAPLHIEIDASARPCFTEDRNYIFFAARSVIHVLTPATGEIAKLGQFTPQNVTSLAYISGYLKAVGDTGGGGSVPGDTHYSDDSANLYASWEVYNNESRPDAMQTMIIAYEQVFNIGTQSVEVTYVDGTVPFSVNKNQAQHFGTPAPGSAVFDGESIYYLAEVTNSRKVIKMAGGGTPQIISFPIDVPLEEFESVADANGYILAFRGQNFYCIDFPTANVTIDGQYWPSMTLAYHIQRQSWLSFATWDTLQGVWSSYTAKSFAYAQNWNKRLIGGNDGKVYEISEDSAIDYVNEPTLTHRWRDDNRDQWANGRTVSLGLPGVTTPVQDQYQCGQYRNRQHSIVYAHITDNGDTFRAELRSGHVTHGRDVTKRSTFYRYNVKRGSNDFVLNGISEQFDYLRR